VWLAANTPGARARAGRIYDGWLPYPPRPQDYRSGLAEVRDYRRHASDSYGFNWLLKIPLEFQQPFEVTHQSMRALKLSNDQPVHERAANLRRAFSGIVAGNIKEYGVNAIERHGPFELAGVSSIMEPLDKLLRSFVAQGRMKFAGTEYKPCYRLVA